MRRSSKRANYLIVLSSDSNDSADENEHMTRRRRTRKKMMSTRSFEHLGNIHQNSIAIIGNNNGERTINERASNIVMENDALSEERTNEIDPITGNNSPVRLVQTIMDQYLPTTETPFEEIKNLVANILNFRIRCKIIYKSSIRFFGVNNKIFDAIVCDASGEIKVVAFNDQVDRLYELFIIDKTIIIENGNVKMANVNFRTPFSTHEILLLSNSNIQSYNSTNFKPIMPMMKQAIRDVLNALHGTSVDVEGIVIVNQEVIATTSASNGTLIRRKSLKIKDETSVISITLWNSKIDEIPEEILNKKIRIRNGKTNHYNDYVSINVSESAMMEFV